MIESLPVKAQERVVEELRDLVEDARDDARWDDLFERKKKSDLSLRPARHERKSPRERHATWIMTNCEIPNAAELLGSLSSPARRA